MTFRTVAFLRLSSVSENGRTSETGVEMVAYFNFAAFSILFDPV